MMERIDKGFLFKQVQVTKSYTATPPKQINYVNLTEEEVICRIQVRNY
jgi:hypothetical protein